MWAEPKVNWQPEDFVNLEDFNRMIENLNALEEYALPYFPGYAVPKQALIGRDDDHAPGFLNAIEGHLQASSEATVHDPALPPRKTWELSGPFYTYEDLNRIEGGILSTYQKIGSILTGKPVLAFELGNDLPF